MIIDGTDCILGKLASVVAKNLLRNEPITVVNTARIIRKGELDRILVDYHMKLKPNKPRDVLYMFRQTVRSMLPRTNHGRKILHNLHCYTDCPERFLNSQMIQVFPFKGRRISLAKIIQNLR